MERAWYVSGKGFGGASVLEFENEPLAPPGPGEMIVRQQAIGVNFIDILQRRGELARTTPYRLGVEAAGEVVAIGEDVAGFAAGDRIVYAGGPPGAYADLRRVPASRAVLLPASVGFDDAAALFFKALTADYLTYRLRPVGPGDAVLFHAASGGVGSLAVPLLKHVGATVIGTVTRREKVEHALARGCDHVVVLGPGGGDLLDTVRRVTGGRGVSIAYDSVGRGTFDLSLASLERFGLLVSFGWSSGEVDPVPPARLREQGSVFLTRPTISHYTERREDLVAGAGRVFEALEAGVYAPCIFERLPLGRAGDAQTLLESAANRGSVILSPWQ